MMDKYSKKTEVYLIENLWEKLSNVHKKNVYGQVRLRVLVTSILPNFSNDNPA